MKKGMFLFLAMLLVTVVTQAQKEFDALRGTHNWPEFSDAPNALYHHIANQAYMGLDKRAQKLSTIRTLAEWKLRQRWLKKTLQQVIGPFPEKTPLNAIVVKTYDKDFYHLENIIYESQPGYYVTSALFLPKGANKAPAIIYCSGHTDNGYRFAGYLKEMLNFVKKGFIVFAFDPLGQGERLQYCDSKTNKSRFKWPSYEHSYSGAQLFITGNTLANHFIWDGMRAVDYLLTRNEVDPDRIGITGRSGGGTQSAYIAAFDDRIKAAAPENYITNLKRLVQAMGPQDAEQNFFYGIDRGLDMADLLEVRAPKPTLVITTSQDMFPIQGAIETCSEVAKIYKAYGKPQHFSMVTDDAPHATTLKNREASYVFFQQSLNNPGNPKEEKVTLPPGEALQVTKTGQVITSLNAETAFSLNCKDAAKRMQQLEAARKNIPAYLPGILQSAKQLSGFREPKETAAPWFAGQIQRKGYVIRKYLLQGEGNYKIPYIVLQPEGPVQKAMVYLNPSGKAADVQEGGDMEWFVKNGVMVVAPDLVGIGEMGPGEFRGDSYVDSVSYNIWFAAMLIHRSIVGIRAGDVIRIVNQLKKEGVKEIYGLAKKQMCPVLLHAAAFDKNIAKIALIQPYSSYRAIVMDEDYDAHYLHSTVAGVIGVYDLPDLEASLAPKALLIAGVTDANGHISDDAGMVNDLSVVKAAYQRMAPGKLQMTDIGKIAQLSDELKKWIGSASIQQAMAKDYPITSFGAKSGIGYLNTAAINKAIDACNKNGGGRVVIPAGIFRSGTIFMKDNVELYLEAGATLLASADIKDFSIQPKADYRSQKDTVGWRALIFANEVSNIAITGFGTIDGNGAQQKPDANALKGDLDGRPRNILFISSKNIHVKGIKMLNAGIWNQHYLNCEDVIVDGINVYNHANRNNDGIDIDGCRRFTVSNSTFDTDDDAIVLKSTGPAACENVVITHCIVSSFCNAIKAGTESTGGFKNISISNCVVKPGSNTHPPIYGTAKGIAALSLEIVDGGIMDGVGISNITIEGSDCPLFVRLGNRARKYIAAAPEPPVGIMRNIVINNVVAYHTGNYSSSITGIPGHYIENLSLSNVQFYNMGGLKQGEYMDDATKVKEDEKGYPQPTVWKELPSSGLFIRHAKNIQVRGLTLNSERPDPRTPVIALDVEGLQIQSIAKVNNNTSDVFFRGWNVKDVLVDTPLAWKKEVVQLNKNPWLQP